MDFGVIQNHDQDDSMLTHLFMPTRLPNVFDRQEQDEAESTLFHSFIKHVNASMGKGIISSALNQFSDDIKQPPDINQLTERITQSFVDSKDNNNHNNIPLITYFKKSNCILVIHRPPTINNNNNNKNNLIQIYPTLDKFNVQTTKLQIATPICSFNIQDVNQLLDTVFLEYLVALRDTDQPPIMSIVHREHSMIPVPNTILNWLIPSIPGCEYNDSTTKYSTPIIYKSIRTEILSADSASLYKWNVLAFKINTLAKYQINSQTTLEYIAHIARSCNKFKIKYQEKHPSMVIGLITAIKERCETLSDTVHQQWDSFCQVVEKESQISTPINNICNGLKEYGTDPTNLVHKSLQQNIKSFINNLKVNVMDLDVKDVNLLTESASDSYITNLENLSKQLYQLHTRTATKLTFIVQGMINSLNYDNNSKPNNVKLVIVLNIIENMIFQIWKSQIFRHSLSNDQQKCQDVFSSIYNLMDIYMKVSKPRYENDAILYSRFILTSYTLVAILDRLTLDYCLLIDKNESQDSSLRLDLYSSLPPYVNLSIFSDLLLQHQYEYEIVESLEFYFEDERHGNTSIDNSIFSIDDNGFGKKWAEQFYQEELQKELDDIEKKTKNKIKEYKHYIETVKAEIRGYRTELLSYMGDSDDHIEKRKIINNYIEACFNSTLSIYYKSMPEKKENQFKLMFETHIPFYLYYVRNSFSMLSKYLYAASSGPKIDYGFATLQTWDLSPPLSIVSLLGENPQKPYSLCIFKNNEDSFIDWNPKTILYYGYKDKKAISDIQAPHIQKSYLLLSIPPKIEYSELNWMIKSNHGIEENDVLATQNQTPKGMLPNEYIRYGMLRVGPNLSIRNMIRYMEERNNLNGIHVLVMFYQLSMQCGPRKKGRSTTRPFRIGWNDENVLQTLCNTIETVLNESQTNWEGSVSMLVIIYCLTIAFNTRDKKPDQKTHEPDDTDKKIIDVLEKCRVVLWEWVAKLEELIQQELLHGRDTETATLRKRMVYTAIAIIMTFNIDNNHKQYIIQHTNYFQHIDYYFKSLIILDENTTISSNGTRTLGSSCPEQPFLDIIFNQLSLIIYRQIPFIVEYFKDGNHFKCLNNIIHNNQGDDGNDLEWEKGSNNNYYQFQINNVIIQFNIFDGTLLFNGTFDRRLPTHLISHKLYKTFFEYSIFEVHQSGNSIWTTNRPINGFNFEFQFASSKIVGIVQVKDNGERWMLLDPDLFKHLPVTLYLCYTHWVNLATNEIEFRPKTFQQYKDGGLDSIKFIGTKFGEIKLESNDESLLYFGENNQALRDQIFKIFPLESKSHFHIYEQEASQLYRIHLNQYGLDFIVDCQNQQINSVQYSGYRLCEQQYIGTLVGLKTILVLEQSNLSGTKKVILPHSPITLEVNDNCKGFNNAKSSTTRLNHPSYFIYDIDRELKMIKSSDLTAHPHLCSSHIVTSSFLRDPFTGLRGMELAIILLKKFKNNMPLNQSQLNILSQIASVSPTRVSQDNIKQQISISYPLLPPMITQDVFVILVDGIKKSHQEMSFLYTLVSQNDRRSFDLALNLIAWIRSKRIFSPLCQIDEPIDTPGSIKIIEPSKLDQTNTKVQRFALIIESKNIDNLDKSFNPYSMIGGSTITGLDVKSSQNCVPEFQETNNLINTRYIARKQTLGAAYTDWYLKLLKIAMETVHGDYNFSRFKFIITLFSCFWSDESLVSFLDHLVLVAISYHFTAIRTFPRETSYQDPITTYDESEIVNTIRNSLDFTEKTTSQQDNEERKAVLDRILSQNIWERESYGIIAPQDTEYHSVTSKHMTHSSIFNSKIQEKINHWYKNKMLKSFFQRVNRIVKDLVQTYGSKPSNLNIFNRFPKFPTPTILSLQNQFNEQDYNNIKLFEQEISQEFQDIWKFGFDKQLESILSTLTSKSCKREKISFGKLDSFIDGIYHETHLEEELFDDLNISKESLKIHLNQPTFEMNKSQSLGEALEELSVIIQQKLDLVWNIIEMFYNNPTRNENVESELDCIFKSCHSWIGCVPLTVYEDFSNHLVDLPDEIYQLIGVHIILQTYKQKIQKCKTIQGVDLLKILSQSRETRQWLPKDYPTWLVFELEQSIWIRDTQAEIAIKLINAQSNECVQLQMGEGKTSVILLNHVFGNIR
ncbi:hypothetical protein DFA_00081 [Cavenderia fasciculata]|uniref:DUF3638 domain-containing protein n=1 Tax=Cavenderia fasciculata TaxID=261658 RepID=F4PXJ3_CACFS|nr:uncharacterized protein DFA_00081 [Cavenderia fasciculata]EGG19503.1 hypothetical protein DFA_00081 [Cavenderia fasciculata]|eukprot:XP_004357797.1 hypothetical protein DFA_00081 [Cavenderia fasciculata]